MHALLLATADQSNGVHILCMLILIGAIVGAILCLLGLLGLDVGPLGRNGRTGYGFLGAPVFITVVLWVVYFVVCS